MSKAQHDWIGLSNVEARKANSRFREYSKTYHLSSVSDKALLEDYIYLEIIGDRIQEQIKRLSNSSDKTTIPKDLMEQFHDNLEQKLTLSEKLGFNITRKETGWLDFWTSLKDKMTRYAQENRGLCTAKCPYCKKLFLLLKKIDDYESFPFIWFKGTLLYNKVLLEFIDTGKLTIEEVSRVFGLQNTDYIKGIYNKIYLRDKSSPNSA